VPLRRYLWQVATATLLVAVCPVLILWRLRSSGVIASVPLGMVLALGLSLGVSYLGRALWETRASSEDLLFGELMVWGFVRRWRAERRLASALRLIGSMNHAQSRVAGGLTAASQAKALEQLGAALEATDPHSQGHSRRVARHAWMIAERIGLPREQVARIRTAAAVHDVGKIETPASILRKPGRLTDEEFDVIKRHPVDGARMVTVLGDAELTSMVRHHHERIDGTGYPGRLSGEEIPLGARIIAVADTFDAITSARPYRPARSHKKAIDVLKYEAGIQLDPDVVRAFCGIYSGRRPLALWASVTSLPGQVFSSIGGGVAGVATAARVAAVATVAAVGAAAVARPVTDHHPTRASTTSSVAATSQVRVAHTAAAQLPLGANARATSHQRRAGHPPVSGAQASGSAPGLAGGQLSSPQSSGFSPAGKGGVSGSGRGADSGEGAGSSSGRGPASGEGARSSGTAPASGEGASSGSGTPPTSGEGASSGSGTPPTSGEGASSGSGTPPTSGEGASSSGKAPAAAPGGSGSGTAPAPGGSGSGKAPASGTDGGGKIPVKVKGEGKDG